jgi:alkanesulfonate monooxygenase SsuD/methylene tetrahydromethanopterin reductase-like flavin-dependent oxidoreductase (luciferase family)
LPTLLVDVLLIPVNARWSQMRDAATAAEEVGFAGLWTWDHAVTWAAVEPDSGPSPRPALECWTVLAALAASTGRMGLGSLVLNTGRRDPVLLAQMSATLQEVCGGRLRLGLGAGASPGSAFAREDALLGRAVLADPVRRDRLAQTVASLRRWWAPNNPLLTPRPPPPVIIGANGIRLAVLAGQVADGLDIRATAEHGPALIQRARTAADGRPFEVSAHVAFHPRWLDRTGEGWQRLARLGVDRLILELDPPYLDAIRMTAGLLPADPRYGA